MAPLASILVVDDDASSRGHLATCLGARGHHVETAADATEAFSALARHDFDAVLADVRMAGLALRREIFRRRPDAVVVMMTTRATVAGAVEAMRAGACDYMVKPFSPQQVERLVQCVREARALQRGNHTHPSSPDLPPLLESASSVMAQAIATARQVAAFDVPILLMGESGTGKSTLAAAIHGWSPRQAGPFVTVSCGMPDEHRRRSEGSSHGEGSSTDAWQDKYRRVKAADYGTLFVEEVAELPHAIQAKLIPFLDEHRLERAAGDQAIEADARVIAATDHDLEIDVRAGRFRQDLFFRLNVVGIHLPPLRERPEDLVTLTDHVLAALCNRHRRERIQVASEARQVLAAHRWLGNVRELVTVLERATVLSRDDVIRADDLRDHLVPRATGPSVAEPEAALALEDAERRHIQQALAEAATLEEAAARLGVNVSTLWRKRKRYGIPWRRRQAPNGY